MVDRSREMMVKLRDPYKPSLWSFGNTGSRDHFFTNEVDGDHCDRIRQMYARTYLMYSNVYYFICIRGYTLYYYIKDYGYIYFRLN